MSPILYPQALELVYSVKSESDNKKRCLTQRAPEPRQRAAEPWWWESAHALRAVRQFAWLGVDSVKAALSRPTSG